jgi:hypothetical protein
MFVTYKLDAVCMMSRIAIPSFTAIPLRPLQLLHDPLLNCGLIAMDNGNMKAMIFLFC